MAQPSGYMSHYTMLYKYCNCTHLLKIKNKLKSGFFTNKVRKNSQYFVGLSNETIIPLALVGMNMRWLSTISYPMSTRGIIVKD